MGVRVRSVVLGIILGSVPTAAMGVWWTYWGVLPHLTQADDQMRTDLVRLEGRFANMVIRFDALDAMEKEEHAETAALSSKASVATALEIELSGHIHAQDGRLDTYDTRMQQLQIELTRLRSDLDGLIAASGRRR